MESRKLPVGIENFEEIRTEGFYYVHTPLKMRSQTGEIEHRFR